MALLTAASADFASSSVLAFSVSQEEAKSALEAVNSAMDQIQILLENIRTDRLEKEIGKIHCRADVRVGDATDGIVFTAQYNDDGDLYVEVSGFGDE